MNIKNSLFSTPTNEFEIDKIILKFKNKSSSGLDRTSKNIIKGISSGMCVLLTFLIN